MSLCTFRSKDYREGMFPPRLAFSPHDLEVFTGDMSTADEGEAAGDEEKSIKMSGSLVEGIQVQNEESQYKLFPPKLDFHATTTKLTSCAPAYDSSIKYAHGQVVSSGEKNYKCKPYPSTSWCSSDKYEPGKSDYWSLAWDLVNGTSLEFCTIYFTWPSSNVVLCFYMHIWFSHSSGCLPPYYVRLQIEHSEHPPKI